MTLRILVTSPDGRQSCQLTQAQVNVITQLLMSGIPQKKINQAALDALDAAGLPAKFDEMSVDTTEVKG